MSESDFSVVTTKPVPFINLPAQYELIADDIQQAVQQLFTTQQFVLGEEVAHFERAIANYCDSREAIGCASGTDALILALMALDIGPGDEVITSPFTFFATASSIARVGAKPVFVDIDPVTYNLDPEKVEEAITPRTRAIMPVHLFGKCAEMEPLWRLAVMRGLSIVEDACQAIGAEYHGRRAGVLGTVGCFSFFPTKNLGGAGDGGIVTTDDKDFANRIRTLRVHGDVGGYEHLEIGINSRLDALQAAVLRIKLKHLEEWTDARISNAAHYRELFNDAGLIGDITLPEESSSHRHVYNQYTIRIHNQARDDVMKHLRAEQIGCAVYYPKPLHLQTCFQSLGYRPWDLPESEKACEEVLSLPITAEVTFSQQERVVQSIAQAFRNRAVKPDSSFPDDRAA